MTARLASILSAVLLVAATARGQTFEECEAGLDLRPDGKEAAACFLTAARDRGAYEEAARRLRERIRSRPDAPWLHYHLATVSWSCREEPEQAYREAVRLFVANADRDGESEARANLAWLLTRCGRLEQARAELPAAEAAARLSSDPLAPLRVQLIRVRLPMRSYGDLESAHGALIRHWETVRQAAFDDRPGVQALRRECLRALGEVCFDLGKAWEARNWYQQRQDAARETGNLFDLAASRYDLVLNRLAYDLPSEAHRRELVAELSLTLPLAEEAAHREIEAKIRLELARLAGGPEAEDHLRRCHVLAGEIADDRLRRRCRLALAGRRLFDDVAEARRLLEDVDGESLAANDPTALVESWSERLRVIWEVYPREEALARAEGVLAAMETLREPQTGMARLQVVDVASGAYYWLSGRLLEEAAPGEPRRAFAVMERLRAQHLREILLFAEAPAPRLPPPPADLLDRVAAALDDDQAMISYHLGLWEDVYGVFAGGAWVLATTRQGTRVHRLAVDRVQIEPAVEMLVDLEGGRWPAATLASLHDELLRPALEGLAPDVRRLVVVPDGILHLLPFGALRAGVDAPALAERYEIDVEPSAALWLSWRESVAAAVDSSILVLADPAFAKAPTGGVRMRTGRSVDALGPLPEARREGRKVLRHLGGRGRLLQGAEASERHVKRADPASFGVLHLATHAVVDVERPWLSGVLLAAGDPAAGDPAAGDPAAGDPAAGDPAAGETVEDGWLRPDEIAALDLDGKVVVLSTCNSATGAWLRGEGVMSLARAFFEAGAHAVVGTLRLLPDDEGERFFDDYYRRLGAGLSLRQALAATQREWAAEGRPASTWASVVVLGNGDLVPVPGGVETTFSFPWWVVLVAVVLGAVLPLLYRQPSFPLGKKVSAE